MTRWSKLQKQLYLIWDSNINIQIHCSIYRMQSRWGGTNLPRYWITLGGEIIFDYPKHFTDKEGCAGYLSGHQESYPYQNHVSDISDLIREYLNTPVQELMTRHFEKDIWGIADILRAADRRIGIGRLDMIQNGKSSMAAQKIIRARQKKARPYKR